MRSLAFLQTLSKNEKQKCVCRMVDRLTALYLQNSFQETFWLKRQQQKCCSLEKKRLSQSLYATWIDCTVLLITLYWNQTAVSIVFYLGFIVLHCCVMTLHLGVKETMFLFVTEQNLYPNMKDSKIPPGFPSLRTLYGACECGSGVFPVPAVSHRYRMPLPSNRKVISRRSKLK